MNFMPVENIFRPFHPQNVTELETMLSERGFELDKWLKKPSDLYQELEEKECILEISDQGEIRRTLDVVIVNCLHTNSNGEREQIFEEGQIRYSKLDEVRQRRYAHLSEKKWEEESIEACALRALGEELGISG